MNRGCKIQSCTFFDNRNNKLLSMTRNKKKKYNKIVTLAKSKLNIIETLVSQALRDLKISHKELLMKKESMKN